MSVSEHLSASVTPPLPPRARAFAAILLGGFASGLMDITAALLVYGALGLKPLRLLQGIAGGVLGPRTYGGGVATALLGLLCHFSIAFGAAAVYVGLGRRMRFLVQHPIAAGMAYGVVVYYFMNLIIVPLSRATKYPFSVEMMAIGVVIHILCIGLPIAFANAHVAKE
jgi:hypothetical protein